MSVILTHNKIYLVMKLTAGHMRFVHAFSTAHNASEWIYQHRADGQKYIIQPEVVDTFEADAISQD